MNRYRIKSKRTENGGKMRKLALDGDILLNIEKPARYIGHEVNSVMKDKKAVDIRFAMCFPEVYGREQMFVSYSIT